MHGKHFLKLQKEKVSLPEGFFSGTVGKLYLEKCLFVIPEGEGRVISISENQKKFAGIEKNVLVVGCGSYFEIWDPESFRKFEEKLLKEYEEIAEKISI